MDNSKLVHTLVGIARSHLVILEILRELAKNIDPQDEGTKEKLEELTRSITAEANLIAGLLE